MFVCTDVWMSDVDLVYYSSIPVFNKFHLLLHLYDSLTFAPTGYFMVLYIQSSRNKVYRSIKVFTAVMCASGKLSLVPQDLEM